MFKKFSGNSYVLIAFLRFILSAEVFISGILAMSVCLGVVVTAFSKPLQFENVKKREDTFPINLLFGSSLLSYWPLLACLCQYLGTPFHLALPNPPALCHSD